MSREEQFVSFVLEGDDPMSVHERFAEALIGEGYVEFVDVAGDCWPFLIETVKNVITRRCAGFDRDAVEG